VFLILDDGHSPKIIQFDLPLSSGKKGEDIQSVPSSRLSYSPYFSN
jgi:hypothetical protein